jgi:hypothetical protein
MAEHKKFKDSIDYYINGVKITKVDSTRFNIAATPICEGLMVTWKPIVSAPKDGRSILLCVIGSRPLIGSWLIVKNLTLTRPALIEDRWVTVEVDDGGFASHDDVVNFLSGSEYHPTHWAECPAGPSEFLLQGPEKPAPSEN